MPNNQLDPQRLPSIFPEYLMTTARRLDHKTIRANTWLKRSAVNAELPSLISRLIKNHDSSYALNPSTTARERSIIECFVGQVVVAPAFTADRLFDDFVATLKSNGLVRKGEERQLAAIKHYIVLFAAIQMHRCAVVINDSFSLVLTVTGHRNGFIEVNCPVPLFFQLPNILILNLSCAIFHTGLKPEEYCEEMLLSVDPNWTFPLELSASGQIRRLQ
jgi:hypothetical protein